MRSSWRRSDPKEWHADGATGEYVHYADGGVATYNAATYEVQQVHFDSAFTGDFTLSLNQSDRADGVSDKTEALSVGCSAYQMKIALEELANVEAVDVSFRLIFGRAIVSRSGLEGKAPISVAFHSFRLIFGRAIASRSGLEA